MLFQRVPFSVRPASLPLQALVLGALLAGCQPAPVEETDGLTSTADSLRVANSLTTHALVLNAISTNPTASDLLISAGLTSLFDPVSGPAYLRQQLLDPDAQQFMSYLVGCALPSGTSVVWKNSAGTTGKWDGILGLCPAWNTGAPSQTCKNWVSSCLLARNNAYGRHVELSMRGEDPTRPAFFTTEPQARPVQFDPDLNGPVPSFSACVGAQTGASRNCGWQVDAVGSCNQGQTVCLGAGGSAPSACGSPGATLGSSSGAHMMLRVCEDIVGCDSTSEHLLGQNDGAAGMGSPAVSFLCPTTGYFNVMTAPYSSTTSGTATVAVETGTPAAARYRLSEKDVFRMREGAYYGNIFDSSALAANVYVDEGGDTHGKTQQVKGSVYRKMYSCQAPEWSSAAAYASYRVCALPSSGSNCAATAVGPCIDPNNRAYPASRCNKEDGTLVAGDGDFEICADNTGAYWYQPITVYLHEPCDLIPAGGTSSCRWTGK